jgi:hypothetical protein
LIISLIYSLGIYTKYLTQPTSTGPFIASWQPNSGLAQTKLGLTQPNLSLTQAKLGLTQPDLGPAQPNLGCVQADFAAPRQLKLKMKN